MVDWGRETFLFASSIVYAFLGVILLIIAYKLLDVATPRDLSHTIFEDHNMAAAILAGAFLVALGLIIAAAIN